MRGLDMRDVLTRGPLFFTVILLCLLWTIPTGGVFISSFRTERAINTSGWWEVFALSRSNPAYAELAEELDEDANAPLAIQSAQRSIDELQPQLESARSALPSELPAVDERLTLATQSLSQIASTEATEDALDDANSAIADAQEAITALVTAEEALTTAETNLEDAGGVDSVVADTPNAYGG